MYVCGPTVYSYPHLGHGRFTLVWDVVRRWLTFLGNEVDYVSNITDIDDKIIARARELDLSEAEVAATWEGHWWEAMAQLGVARPTHSPHATEYVEQMVSFISSLLEKQCAYQTAEGVYFDVTSVGDYGLLAGQSLESLRSGARVEPSEHKRNPIDFALWKAAKEGEPSWEAPFGAGRPGWHTECVVMSLSLLGNDFDLHCGGLDLKFPHHENERAQAVAHGEHFAHHWGHNGFVMVGDEKMSKSLNNFTSLTDLLAHTDPRAYRLLVVRSHYRSPIDVSAETIGDAERSLERLDALARRFALPERAGDSFEMARHHVFTGASQELVDEFSNYMNDDLNSPLAVAALFEAVSRANAWADGDRLDEATELAETVGVLCGALGLSLRGVIDEGDEESRQLVAERDGARAAKDWARADELRQRLEGLGWVVEDGAGGTQIRRP
jgi:cysteinyl-tRNA synthetase